MTSYISAPKDLNEALAVLTFNYLRGQSKLASGVKERNRLEGIEQGYRKGICEGIAMLLTQERVSRFKHVTIVKSIPSWDIEEVLSEYLPKWQVLANGSDKSGIEGLSEEYEALIEGGGHAAENEEVRRRKILAGEITPVEADIEWLTVEAESRKEFVNTLEDILRAAKIEAE